MYQKFKEGIIRCGRPTHLVKSTGATYCGKMLIDNITDDVDKFNCLVCYQSHKKEIKWKKKQ